MLHIIGRYLLIWNSHCLFANIQGPKTQSKSNWGRDKAVMSKLICVLCFGSYLFSQCRALSPLHLTLFNKHVMDEFAVHCIFHEFIFWDVPVPILVHCGSGRVSSSSKPSLHFIEYKHNKNQKNSVIWLCIMVHQGSEMAIIKTSSTTYFLL